MLLSTYKRIYSTSINNMEIKNYEEQCYYTYNKVIQMLKLLIEKPFIINLKLMKNEMDQSQSSCKQEVNLLLMMERQLPHLTYLQLVQFEENLKEQLTLIKSEQSENQEHLIMKLSELQIKVEKQKIRIELQQTDETVTSVQQQIKLQEIQKRRQNQLRILEKLQTCLQKNNIQVVQQNQTNKIDNNISEQQQANQLQNNIVFDQVSIPYQQIDTSQQAVEQEYVKQLDDNIEKDQRHETVEDIEEQADEEVQYLFNEKQQESEQLNQEDDIEVQMLIIEEEQDNILKSSIKIISLGHQTNSDRSSPNAVITCVAQIPIEESKSFIHQQQQQEEEQYEQEIEQNIEVAQVSQQQLEQLDVTDDDLIKQYGASQTQEAQQSIQQEQVVQLLTDTDNTKIEPDQKYEGSELQQLYDQIEQQQVKKKHHRKKHSASKIENQSLNSSKYDTKQLVIQKETEKQSQKSNNNIQQKVHFCTDQENQQISDYNEKSDSLDSQDIERQKIIDQLREEEKKVLTTDIDDKESFFSSLQDNIQSQIKLDPLIIKDGYVRSKPTRNTHNLKKQETKQQVKEQPQIIKPSIKAYSNQNISDNLLNSASYKRNYDKPITKKTSLQRTLKQQKQLFGINSHLNEQMMQISKQKSINSKNTSNNISLIGDKQSQFDNQDIFSKRLLNNTQNIQNKTQNSSFQKAEDVDKFIQSQQIQLDNYMGKNMRDTLSSNSRIPVVPSRIILFE